LPTGDPTVGGWQAAVLYLVASISCWMLARKRGLAHDRRSRERRAWRSISALFFFLGINKQLDLQTDLRRSRYQGWYEQRWLVQLAFIALIAVTCLISAIILLIWVRDAPMSNWLALIGTTLVISYVLIRAASFYHVDRLIGQKILGFRWNWILEIGGIGLVLLASLWRQFLLAEWISRSFPLQAKSSVVNRER
jgi:hypothetical protein